jgi:radical SAM protein with 4Fe4S-binding SPASM domain
MSEKTKIFGNIHEIALKHLDVDKVEKYFSYRNKFDKANSFERVFDHPIHVDIELDNICNYACSFCPIGQPESELGKYYKIKKEISVDKIKEILIELKKIGTNSVQLSLVNEPLANKHLFEVLSFASELKFEDLYMVSNASLLTEKKSIAILNSGLTKIQFSLDGFSEKTYEMNRFTKVKKPGMYNKVLKNILEFLNLKNQMKKKFPLVRVSFIELDENKHEFNDFKKFWEDKVDAIHYQKLIKYGKENKSFNFYDGNKIRCNMPNFRLAIKSDGLVKPCCVGYGEKITIGDIYKNTISEIWNSEIMKNLQKLHLEYKSSENKHCKECLQNTKF